MKAASSTSASEARVTPDQVCLSEAEVSRPTSQSLLHQAGRCLLLGCGLVGGAIGMAHAAQAQQAQVQVRKGVRFDLTEMQVMERTRNTVTADQIEEGQPHFTAWDIDPNQASKHYHNPSTLTVDEQHSGRTLNEGERFLQCGRQSAEGTCHNVKPNQIRYSVLSCIYQKQEDGQLYRVTHKSYQHNYTPAMQRNVCGGHELRYSQADMTYTPQQVNQQGDQLFLNPANILRIEAVNP
jgi:uncharacterized protein YqiB (DUF1249 family)